MKAIKCDRCGALCDHAGFQSKEFTDKTEGGWERKMSGHRVVVRIEPVEDPTGFGGMELCGPCFQCLGRKAFQKLGLAPISGETS